MILSRLVWMQVRSYSFDHTTNSYIQHDNNGNLNSELCEMIKQHPAGFGKHDHRMKGDLKKDRISQIKALMFSPSLTLLHIGICELAPQGISEESYLKWHIKLMLMTVFVCTLLARVLTSSWLIALLVATVLMSRGALLAQIGWLSMDMLISFFLCLYMLCTVIFLRTCSTSVFRLGFLVFLAMVALEPFLFVAALTLPLYLFFVSPKSPIQAVVNEPNLLKTLTIPWATWAFAQPEPQELQDEKSSIRLVDVRYSLLAMSACALGLALWVHFEWGYFFLGRMRSLSQVFSVWTQWNGGEFVLALLMSFGLWLKSMLWVCILPYVLNLHFGLSLLLMITVAFSLVSSVTRIQREQFLNFLIFFSGVTISCFISVFFLNFLISLFFLDDFSSVGNMVFEDIPLRSIMAWFEPLILTYGVCAVFSSIPIRF